MVTARGRARPPLEDLLAKPYSFDFFQAVRLLERAAIERADDEDKDAAPTQCSVGLDNPPHQEVVRFRAHASLGFPPSAICDIKPPSTNGQHHPAEMTVGFLGLTGPTGALPRHYSSMIAERIRNKDFGLRDFFDLFNHRLISLFYRAWEKYRFPIAFEKNRLADKPLQDDLFTRAVAALIGFGTPGLRGRCSVVDDVLLHYGGTLSHSPRSPVQLEQLLSDYFGVPVRIDQFQGQWLSLTPENRSSLGGANARLGVDSTVGQRVWDIQAKFRVRLGALSYVQFSVFMPGGSGLKPLCEIVRLYVGPEYDFDVQPVLKAAEVPRCQLGKLDSSGNAPRLGRNIWAFSKTLAGDFEGAVFSENT